MKYIFLPFILLFTLNFYSQEQPNSNFSDFSQFEISIPLQGNKNRGDQFPDGSKNENWFLPDGVNANFGYGIHYNKWIGLSANTGIAMKLSEKLVMAPSLLIFELCRKWAKKRDWELI